MGKASKKNKSKSAGAAAGTSIKSRGPTKKSRALYGTHNEAAVMAFHRGAHREAADEYLKAVLAAPDHWMEQKIMGAVATRYHTFHGYTSLLREIYFAPTEADFQTLECDFLNNKEEPVIFRVEAGWTLGLLNYDRGRREVTADFYRIALQIAETITPDEAARSTHAILQDQST